MYCTCPLYTAGWYILLGIVLSVVYVPVLHVRNIQPGDIPVVTEYPAIKE